MDWFKTTASFWSHPKVVDLRDGPFRVLVSGWGYAAQHNTGGRITPAALRMVGGKPSDAKALVQAGLWHIDPEGGWRIHDWDDHQEAAVAWHRKRERDREAARNARAERRATVARLSNDDPPTESHDSRKTIREEKRRGEERTPSPSGEGTPDPPGEEEQGPATPRQRGANSRARGANPRSRGTNPRAQGTNPRADGNGRRRNMTPDEVEAAAERIEAEMRERIARESGQ